MPETRYCPRCGASVALQSAFCGTCGNQVNQQQGATLTATRPAPPAPPTTPNRGPAPPPPPRGPAAAAPEQERAQEHAQEYTRQTGTTTEGSASQHADHPGDRGVPQAFDIGKVSRTAFGVALCGLVALIASFQPWYTVNLDGVTALSDNAWSAGLISWLPVMLLVGIGIGAVLPALGQRAPSAITTTLVGLVSTVLLVIRVGTLPTYSNTDPTVGSVSQGAGVGLGLALLMAVVVTVLGLVSGGARFIAHRYEKIKQQRGSGSPPSGS